MNVTEQQRPAATVLPGIAHATWAGRAAGVDQIEIWRQSLAPGSATPPHRHDCDEVVLCESGSGEVHSEGRVLRFGAASVISLPRDRVHQILNVGRVPLEITGIFAASPPVTVSPEGAPLPLPWRG